MSHTIAHRHGTHMHVPWVPILAVLATVIVAAAVLVIINQPSATTSTPATETGSAAVVAPASVSRPEVVTSQAEALAYYKRNYSPNVNFVPAIVVSASVPTATTYRTLPAAVMLYKRTYDPNRP